MNLHFPGQVNHGSPVECGCAFPGAALYASGGGTAVKVWDLAMTGKVLQELNDAHSKAIAAMALMEDDGRWLASGELTFCHGKSWKDPPFWVGKPCKPSINGPFWIAMLVYQRVAGLFLWANDGKWISWTLRIVQCCEWKLIFAEWQGRSGKIFWVCGVSETMKTGGEKPTSGWPWGSYPLVN